MHTYHFKFIYIFTCCVIIVEITDDKQGVMRDFTMNSTIRITKAKQLFLFEHNFFNSILLLFIF